MKGCKKHLAGKEKNKIQKWIPEDIDFFNYLTKYNLYKLKNCNTVKYVDHYCQVLFGIAKCHVQQPCKAIS